jgi:hypothetical protein
MQLFIQITLCAFYVSLWIYLLLTMYYKQYIYPINFENNTPKKNKTNKNINISYNHSIKYDTITFPHYRIYSKYSYNNKIISYQLAEFLDIQPGICMSKEDIYNLIFKYIKNNIIFHKNKILILPNIQLLLDNNNSNITLNNLPDFIEPHIKNI